MSLTGILTGSQDPSDFVHTAPPASRKDHKRTLHDFLFYSQGVVLCGHENGIYINTSPSGLDRHRSNKPPSLGIMALATTKVALVTGAARGIGRAIALRLADDGLDVAVNDRSSSPELDGVVREIESKGRRSIAVPGDISLEPEVEKSIQKVVQDLGGLDVVRSFSWR